jgi:hypothetical protein
MGHIIHATTVPAAEQTMVHENGNGRLGLLTHRDNSLALSGQVPRSFRNADIAHQGRTPCPFNKCHQPNENMAKQRKKMHRWTIFVVLAVASAGFVVACLGRGQQESEQRLCDKYCKSEYGHTHGVLVPIVTNQRTRPQASMGPYKCTCPR